MLRSVSQLLVTHRPYTRLAALVLFAEQEQGARAIRSGMAWTNEIVSAVEGNLTFVSGGAPPLDQWAEFERRCKDLDIGGFVVGRADGVHRPALDALVRRAAGAWVPPDRVAVWPDGGAAWPLPDAEALSVVADLGGEGETGRLGRGHAGATARHRAIAQAYLEDVLRAVGGVNTFG
jgi:hypothetical protein